MARVSSIKAAKIAKQAGLITSSRPADSNGETPRNWSDCVGYEVEGVEDLDLVAAVEIAVRANKIKPSDKPNKTKLDNDLKVEKAKAKSDREKTPANVKLDDPLKKQRG